MTRVALDGTRISCPNCERVLTDRLTSRPAVDAVNADHAAGVRAIAAS